MTTKRDRVQYLETEVRLARQEIVELRQKLATTAALETENKRLSAEVRSLRSSVSSIIGTARLRQQYLKDTVAVWYCIEHSFDESQKLVAAMLRYCRFRLENQEKACQASVDAAENVLRKQSSEPTS